MARDDDVNVRFGADTSDAEAGLSRFSGSLTGAITVGVALGETLQNVAAEGIRVLSQQLQDSITLVARQAEEMEKFAFRMGTTTEEATGLREALEEVGVTTDAYEGVLMRLSRQVKTNEDGLNKLGVVTRDGNGQLLNQNTLLQNALKTMLEYKAGTDRNQASLMLFGRTAADVSGLIRLTTQGIEEATVGAHALGLEITQNDVQAFHAFQRAQANVTDAFEAMKLVMSRDILPLLTETMNFITSKGEDGLTAFGQLWRWVANEAEMAAFSFIQVKEKVVASIEGIRSEMANLAKAKDQFADSHWIDAWKTLSDPNAANMESSMRAAEARIDSARIAMEASISLRNAGAYGAGTVESDSGSSIPGGAGSRDFTSPGRSGRGGGAGRTEDVFSTYKAELEKMRDAAGLFRTLELSEEIKFWEQKAELAKGMPKVVDKVNHELATTRRKQAAEELSEALKALDAQKEIYTGNAEAIVQIEKAKQALIAATVGEGSTKYIDAERQVTRATRAEAQERLRIASDEIDQKRTLRMVELDDEVAQLAFSRSIGAVNGEQEINERRRIEAEKYRVKQEALRAQLELDGQTMEQQRKLHTDLELLELEHVNRVKELDRQAVQERISMASMFLGPIQSAFSTSIDAIIRGTTTLGQAFKNMAANILLSFINLGIQMLFRWIAVQIGMTSVQTSAEAARATVEEASIALGVAANAAGNIAKIVSLAAVAAAGAFAMTMATVPWPYSMAAAAAAAGYAYSGTMAFAPLAAAEGGWWDIPGTQAAILHNREMVLPADIAEGLRGLVGSGGNQQVAPLGGNTTINISAVDAQSVRKLFMREGASLMSSFKAQVRNFNTRTAY